MRKFFYVAVIPLVGSVLANVMYTVPQMVTWHYSLAWLLVLSLLTTKLVRSQRAVSFGQRRCLLMAGLVIAPLLVSLAIRQFGNPDGEATRIPTAWLRSIYHNQPWILENFLPESGMVVKQDWLARTLFVEAGSWCMLFICWPRPPRQTA